jgi:hypothetical protein
LIYGVIPIRKVFSFQLDCNIRPDYIVQGIPCSSILGSQVILDGVKGTGSVPIIDQQFIRSLLETNFMLLLILVTAYQRQVDSVHHGLPMDYFQQSFRYATALTETRMPFLSELTDVAPILLLLSLPDS